MAGGNHSRMDDVDLYTVVFDEDVAASEFDLADLGESTALAAHHLLVMSALTQSRLYHEIKWRLPENAALFVGELAATPKMKGQASGSVAWAREAVELNGLFGRASGTTGVADER